MDQLYRMPARWRKSYKEDLELRGEPTQTIEIYNYSYRRLLHYQKHAHQQLTYHITRQNCCTTVVDALEISTFGWLGRNRVNLNLIVKLLVNDLFWLSASLRFRARSFAWTTTGLLKYSNAVRDLLPLAGQTK